MDATMTTVVEAFASAVDTIQANALQMAATAVPAGLAIAGVSIVVMFGVRFFRNIAK